MIAALKHSAAEVPISAPESQDGPDSSAAREELGQNPEAEEPVVVLQTASGLFVFRSLQEGEHLVGFRPH